MKKKEYQKQIKKLERLFKGAANFLILTHKRPDGDALGSTLALKIFLERQGRTVNLAYLGEVDDCLGYLPGLQEKYFLKKSLKELDADIFGKIDLVIVCDASDLKRTGLPQEEIFELEKKFKKRLVFLDHHRDEVKEGLAALGIVQSDFAATCLIVYDFFQLNNLEITKDIATCLLTGIFTDTGGFMHANTTSKIMQAASDLMRKGASLTLIAKKNFSNKKVNTLRAWGRILERASLNEKNRMAFSYVTQKDLAECGVSVEDLSGVTNVLGAAEESSYSLLLAETEDQKIKGSLRSEEHKNCDVSKIAKNFGGGGHKLASGFECKGKIVDKEGNAIVA